MEELSGAELDAAVAQAMGKTWRIVEVLVEYRYARPVCMVAKHSEWTKRHEDFSEMFQPSFDWRHGGPIIDRERIQVLPYALPRQGWYADIRPEQGGSACAEGPTPLVAAMRAYVASRASWKPHEALRSDKQE